jgi:hypothetical protein
VISSYTPTLKALRYSQDRAKKIASSSTDQAYVLTVAIRTTPVQTDLPGVIEEVSRITKLIPKNFVVQPLAGPTAEVVLGQLENHDIFHFACHRSSNIFNP